MTPVRLEPAALRSRVKHSTTEPLRSLIFAIICKLRDAFGEFVACHHKSKCYQTTRIQRLFDSLSFVDEEQGVHVQCMLEISRVLYTGGNLSNMFGEKITGNLGPYLRLYDLVPTYFALKYIMRSLLA